MTTQPATDTVRTPEERHVNVVLTFTTDRPASEVGATITAAASTALPDELTSVNWHAYTLPASETPEEP